MNNVSLYENSEINEKVLTYTHPSGLKVSFVPKDLSVAYASLTVKFGGIYKNVRFSEDDDFSELPNGVAHFLEHKMFSRPDGSDAINEFALYGANANAYTSENATSYIFYCSENFEKNLEILLDFVFHPYFTDENVENERGIIAEEIKMYYDNPSAAIYYNLLEGLYSNHAIKNNICGSESSIKKITPRLLYRVHGAFYVPSNMVLAISGNCDMDKIVAIVDKALSGYENKAIPKMKFFDEPTERVSYSTRQRCEVSEYSYIYGFKLLPLSSPRECEKRSIAYDILEELMLGKSSKFYNKMYKKGFISVPMSLDYEFGNGYAFSSVSVTATYPNKIEKKMKAFIKNISKFKISKKDFKRVKSFILANFVRDFDSTESIVENIVADEVMGSNIFECTDIIREIEIDYLREILKTDFDTEKMSISVIEPRSMV